MRTFKIALLSAVVAVALVMGLNAMAAFTTFAPPVTNDFTKVYFQELRGYKMVYAVAGTADADATTTITGMEAGDVIIDIVNLGAGASTISSTNLANIDETLYTAASGGATHDTSTGLPTAADNLVVIFVDVDNTN